MYGPASLASVPLPGYGPDAAVPDAPDILDGRGNTGPVRVVMTPGERKRYSGGAYTVMQQLVADVRGEPFAAVLRKHALDPIGMIRSTYEQPIPLSRQDDVAKGYRPDGATVVGGWHTYPEQAAAGSDLTREIAITVADAHGWSGPRPRELVPVDLAADVRGRYVGTYVAAERGIEFRGGARGAGVGTFVAGRWGGLWALNDSIYFDVEDGREVRFSTDGDRIELVLGTLRVAQAAAGQSR